VPVSAYDAFAALAAAQKIHPNHLATWNALIGIRNRTVHDDMNIEMVRIHELVRQGGDGFVIDFLNRRLEGRQ
jgi:hypothetical protein